MTRRENRKKKDRVTEVSFFATQSVLGILGRETAPGKESQDGPFQVVMKFPSKADKGTGEGEWED